MGLFRGLGLPGVHPLCLPQAQLSWLCQGSFRLNTVWGWRSLQEIQGTASPGFQIFLEAMGHTRALHTQQCDQSPGQCPGDARAPCQPLLSPSVKALTEERAAPSWLALPSSCPGQRQPPPLPVPRAGTVLGPTQVGAGTEQETLRAAGGRLANEGAVT